MEEKIDGLVNAELQLTYNYKGRYMSPKDVQNSFNNLPSDTLIDLNRSNNVISLSTNLELILNSDWITEQKLGGWDFGFHNTIKKDFNSLYKGSGNNIKDVKVNGSIEGFLNKGIVYYK